VASVSIVVALALRDSALLGSLERQTIDARFSLRGARRPSPQVALIGLDANSIAHLPQFPFSRTIHAQVITRLHRAGARVIVYDFAFDRPTTDAADLALFDAAQAAAPVIFATTLISNGQTEVMGGSANLRSIGAYPAAGLLPTDSDGVIRHLASDVSGLPTVAEVAASVTTHHAPSAAALSNSGAWIDFAGPPGTFRAIPFLDVYRGTFDPALVRNKVVIVGPTAPVLQDLHATAAGGPMSGPEVQANAIATMLAGLPLRNADAWIDVLAVVLSVLVVCACAWRRGALWVGGVGLAIVLGWSAASVIAFDHGAVLQLTPVLVAVALSGGGALVVAASADARERRHLRELFAAASPEAVAQILRGGAGAVSPTGVVAGYRMEELLATGGMGVVYRATQLALGRTVAIKLIRPERALDPEFRARFERECRAVAAVEHANVIPVYEAGEDDGLLFIAMRLVNGVDLGRLLLRLGPLTPARTMRIIEQLAGALDAAHARGLVHRDVKPANVLLAAEEPEHVYLTDFGVAKELGGAEVTRADHWVGTLDFLAPEQLRGEPLSGRADVYALTGVLYQCLVGEPPYPRDTDAAKLWAHLHAEAPRPSERDVRLPRAIDEVVAVGLATNPAGRYATAAALANAAAAALGLPSELGVAPALLPAEGEEGDGTEPTSVGI